MTVIIALTPNAQEDGPMATVIQKPAKTQAFQARPRPSVDRKALREKINAQYKNTLTYLGQ